MILRSDYFWPALIVTLLVFNVATSMTIVFFASSDGGPEIIPDYYEKSVDFDDQMATERASQNQGWTVTIELTDGLGELTVVDAQDRPVTDLAGTIDFYRPHRAEPVAQVAVEAVPRTPGLYRFDNIALTAGLWDLAIDLNDGERTYVERRRRVIH